MKKFVYVLILAILVTGCSDKPEENILLQEWETPFETPPFDKIKNEHFMPAFLAAMAVEKAEVEAIANNKEGPAFKNTMKHWKPAASCMIE